MKQLTALMAAVLLGVANMFALADLRSSVASGSPTPGATIQLGNDIPQLMNQGDKLPASPGIFNVASRKATSPILNAPASGANIYGWLVYKEPTPTDLSGLGVCKMGTDGTYQTLGYGVLNFTDYPGFFIRDGRVCTYLEYFYINVLLKIWYVEYDMETGQLVREEGMPARNAPNMFRSGAYDAKNDVFYAYMYASKSGDTSMSRLIKIDMKKPTEIIHIADVPTFEICLSMTWNQDEDELIGINQANEIVRIDRATGIQTVLANFPIARAERKTGLCWSPKDNVYYLNVNTASPIESYLYLLDADTYKPTRVAQYPGFEDFTCFYCTDVAEITDDAPQDAVLKEFNFLNGDLSGNIVYTMPSVTGNATPIIGNVEYEIRLDGNSYKTGSAPAGTDVKIDFSDLSEGEHTFKIYISYNGVKGRALKTTKYIGADTPIIPANVKMDATGISWDACNVGMYNGYIDPDKLYYNVYVNGDLVGRHIKDTHYDYQYPNTDVSVYYATVEAECDGRQSEMSDMVIFAYGNPLTIPVYIEPSKMQQYMFTTENTTGDGVREFEIGEWKYGTYAAEGTGYFHKENSAKNDHWLFLPAVNFTSEKTLYTFALEAATRGTNKDEIFEVAIGKEPKASAMTKTIIEPTHVTNQYFESITTDFKVPEAGGYYIGIHCISAPGSYYLFVRNFEVYKSTNNPLVPEAATNLKFTPGNKGELNATVEFKLPETNLEGEKLDATEQLTATVTCSNNGKTASVTGLPGETVSAVVTTNQGDNAISVQVSNNEGLGRIASGNVYCGVDVPGAPENFDIKASDDNMSVILTWDAPSTTGLTGGYVAPEGISYYFATFNESTGSYEIGDFIGKDVYTASYQLPAGTAQKALRLGVMAKNVAGTSTRTAGGSVIVGQPYTLPMRENFADGKTLYTPLSQYTLTSPSSATWVTDVPGIAGEKYRLDDGVFAFIAKTSRNSDMTRLGIPKFSTEGITNPSLFLNIYAGGCADVEVFAQTYGTELVSLGKLSSKNLTEGYTKVEFNLPEQFRNKKWVALYIDATFSSSDQACVITSYQVKDSQARDLAVCNLNGTTVAYIESAANYTATVVNDGYEAIAFGGARWTVENEAGTILFSTDVEPETETIAPDAEKQFTFSFSPDVDMAGDIIVRFMLTGSDMVKANDSLTLDVNVTSGDELIVTDLRAVAAGPDFIELEWTEPDLSGGVESFEADKAFVHSPATVGQFRNIDGDKGIVYANQNVNYPNKNHPGAFTVWSHSELPDEDAKERFTAADGDKFLMAFCPAIDKNNVPADDWLISPKVTGDSEVSFFARAITYAYGAEKIEALYSTTDRNPESFTRIETIEVNGNKASTPEWQKFTFRLPADAKYFALRYVSNDIMGICIDKIQWKPWYTGTTLDGYDIYRDNVCIMENEFAPGYFRDETINDADAFYRYHIVPVLKNGQKGIKSNVVTVQPSGVSEVTSLQSVTTAKGTIIVNSCDNANVVIFAADAKAVAADKHISGKKVYSVEPGVYVVTVNGVTTKVIVP